MLHDTTNECQHPRPLLDTLAHTCKHHPTHTLLSHPALSCPGPQRNNQEAGEVLGRAAWEGAGVGCGGRGVGGSWGMGRRGQVVTAAQ